MANVTFKVRRRTDKEALACLQLIAQETSSTPTSSQYQARTAHTSVNFNWASPEADTNFQKLLAVDQDACQTIGFNLSSYIGINLARDDSSLFDVVTVSNNGGQNNPASDFQGAMLTITAKRVFGAYNTAQSLAEFFPDQAKVFQEAREASVNRLEELNLSMVEHTEEYRAAQDRRVEEVRQRLEAEATSRRAEQDEEHKEKLEALQKREADLEERIKAIDTQESRIARRGLRKELQAELQQRAERFELTKGTRRLRIPVIVVVSLMGLYLGVMAGVYFNEGIKLLTDHNGVTAAQIIAFSVKQFVVTAGFIGVCSYFIRWTNQWFDQHAREEFRLKRFGLDVDWANWVVETAMEWKKENEHQIPTELLVRLTGNLFADERARTDEASPADQLASALLGASASASLETPAGKLVLDRKGIEKLADGKK